MDKLSVLEGNKKARRRAGLGWKKTKDLSPYAIATRIRSPGSSPSATKASARLRKPKSSRGGRSIACPRGKSIRYSASSTSSLKRRIRARLRCLSERASLTNGPMSDRQQIYAKTVELIEPFNKKGVAITEATRFAQDLEWDSLTVLDFVANIEDEFDVIITMNMQAEIETVGQLIDALERLIANRA
jgi:acyl carrier protein